MFWSELVGRGLDACELMRGPAQPSEVQLREAVADACRRLPLDSPLAMSSRFPGFVRRAQRTLEELRLWGWTPESLESAADSASEPLAAKLRSLAFLEQETNGALVAMGTRRVAERIARCLEVTGGSALSALRILVFAGSEPVPLYCNWIRWAVDRGAAITVVADGHSVAGGVFHGTARLERLLGVEAAAAGSGHPLADCLFADQPKLEVDLAASIVSAADPLAECEWALRRILANREPEGKKESFSIFCRSLADYAPILEASANRLGVSLCLPRRNSLVSNGLVRCLANVLECVATADSAGLARAVRSSYLGVAAKDAESVAAALREMKSDTPDWAGLRGLLPSESDASEKLAEFARVREGLPNGAAPLRDWLASVLPAMEWSWVAEATRRPSETQARDDAALGAFRDAVMSRIAVPGSSETHCAPESFSLELRAICDNVEFTTPVPLSGVPVASSGEEADEADHVLVLGMLEGGFPRRRSEDPILGDFEREALNAMRPQGAPLLDSHDWARGERDEFLRVCASAGKSIAFFYPQADDERDNVPAYYLEELRFAVGGGIESVNHPRGDLAPAVSECVSEADARLADALSAPRERPSAPEFATEEAAAAMRPSPEDQFSPVELRQALECPFRAAFHRRLRLEDRARAIGWDALRSLPVRAELPSARTPEEAHKRLREALKDAISEIGDKLSDEEKRLVAAGGRRLIAEWVEREFRARELWPKDDPGSRLDVRFGEPGLVEELPLRSKKVRLRGRAAALSRMGGYSVAHLSGARRSLVETKNLDELLDSDRLELGVYLWAMSGQTPAVAVEADSNSGQRTLFVLPRLDSPELQARQSEGLRVVDLGERRSFFGAVKESLEIAVENLESGTVRPCPGDHCRTCSFGELCRRAQGYSEEESVFESEDDEPSA